MARLGVNNCKNDKEEITHICHTASVTWLIRIDSSCEINPAKVFHYDAGIVRSHGCTSSLNLCLCGALIVVRLRDVNWKCNIKGTNVLPSDILGESLPPNPGFEACCIDGVDDSDVV